MTLEEPGPAPAPDAAADPPRATRRRGAALDAALLDAAWDVLVTHGYSGLTYDAVATRARTSRAVLYRRWPQRHQLLEDTLRRVWVPLDLPDTGTLRDDALTALRTLADARGPLMTVLVRQLADYYRETGRTFEDLRSLVTTGRPERPFHEVVARAVRRGELADTPRSDRVLELPLDLLRLELVMRGTAPDDAPLAEIVDDVWLPLLART